jgi:hypothetical protein
MTVHGRASLRPSRFERSNALRWLLTSVTILVSATLGIGVAQAEDLPPSADRSAKTAPWKPQLLAQGQGWWCHGPLCTRERADCEVGGPRRDTYVGSGVREVNGRLARCRLVTRAARGLEAIFHDAARLALAHRESDPRLLSLAIGLADLMVGRQR